jgi:superfamily II DNA or RNA helicase/diadenosine tetraphosphate (Ap4A) HIT family hydrolase/HKD family nuclease/SOS-response transcriptional repressor LexA
MESAAPAPFLGVPEAEWVCANELCFAIFDSFPVSPGHVLVITRRVVPTFFECSAAEQAALMELVGDVKRLLDERLDPKPDGYNVGFNAGTAAGQTVPHVHVHVIPRYAGDMPDPRGGVRHVIPEKGNYLVAQEAPGGSRGTPGAQATHPSMQTGDRPTAGSPSASAPAFLGTALSLTTGPNRPLWHRLADRLPGASEIDLLASFVQPSGLDLVGKSLFRAIAAGATVRLLVGDYLGITSPDALRQLLGWMEMAADGGRDPGRPGVPGLPTRASWEQGTAEAAGAHVGFEARLAELENLRGAPDSFHPKAWRIADASGGIVVVGSSNLSRAALETGVEWNLVIESAASDCLKARGASRGNAASSPIDVELKTAFDDLWRQSTPLSADVVERYAARAAAAADLRRVWDEGPGSPGFRRELPSDGQEAPGGSPGTPGDQPPRAPDRSAPPLTPRPWQAEALASLAAIRADGYSKALVAVATGLGKTWLAAFDVVAHGKALGRPPRVLVIAHRAEILAQAEATLRQALESEWRGDPESPGFRRGLPGVAIESSAQEVPGGSPGTPGSQPPHPPHELTRSGVAVSYVAGSSCDLTGELVIASIQKLSRPDSLAALAAAPPFDYCVIDEVHHAEAPSYRRVLARLPRHDRSFTLGLTATPERTDGVDVATLFDDILAYQATIGDGIAEGSLVPFRYRGLKDDVDYDSSKIPWRNGRFDPGALEAALENSARMERLWAEWQAAPAGRTLVFCCSRRHALFARDWLVRRGVAAAAVFSGDGGDPRMASLAAFQEGRLAALCVVDLFNEGIDLPLVDRVVMLRPTESKIVFLQQLGRGLRAATGKARLEVIDFVGNHRVFASRLVHLLSLVPGPEGSAAAASFDVLKAYLAGGEPELPAGCVLDVEMEAKRLLEQFLPRGRGAVVEAYRALRAELGRRPTPTELLHAGYLPLTVSADHGSWFEFCGSEGDLSADEQAAATAAPAPQWLKMLQTTSLTKSYKMVVLRVLLDHDALWAGMEISALATACRRFLESHPALRADLAEIPLLGSPKRERGKSGLLDATSVDLSADPAFTAYWLKWPLSRWMDEQSGRRWFVRRGDRFVADFPVAAEHRPAFESLTGELVDYRLAHYTQSRLREPAALEARSASEGIRPTITFRAKLSHTNRKPILFLPTVESAPSRPTGPTRVCLPDGSEWVFRFVKVACNVAHPADAADKQNQLPVLLRDWFGPDAGLPGTNFEVEFSSIDGSWSAAPVSPSPSAAPVTNASGVRIRDCEPKTPPLELIASPPHASRYTTHVPVYDLTAAAGFWGPESVPEEIGWTEVPGVSLKPGMFVARVTGTSMEPLIPDGSWCLFRPCPAGSREGRIVLVQLGTDGAGETGGRFTVKKYHSKKTVTADGWRHDRIQLLPVNPAFEPIEIEPEAAGDLIIVGEHSQCLAHRST